MDRERLLQEIAELLEESGLPEEMKQLIRHSKLSKRARIVVRHILKYGSVTTESIEEYGYKHPPRAIGDVRDAGIPLRTIPLSRVF